MTYGNPKHFSKRSFSISLLRMLLLRQLSKASRLHKTTRGVSANRFFSEITERSATNRDRYHRLARVRCAARRAVSCSARSKNTRAFLFLVFKKCAFFPTINKHFASGSPFRTPIQFAAKLGPFSARARRFARVDVVRNAWVA